MNAPHWIIANLDAEDDWARLHAPDVGRWPRSLPLPVLQKISLFGTLLRVWGRDGDVLWTPAPIDPRCVREVPGLPSVSFVHGPDAKVPADASVTAWAAAPPAPIERALFEATAKVNDRAFALRLTERFGVALPGSRVVRTIEQLIASEVGGGRWVAKAPHGAAGRNRVLGEGRWLDENQRGALAALLKEHGRLIVQPWVNRTLDFGMWLDPGEADADGDVRWTRGVHELQTDERGRFQGIVVSEDGPALDAPAFLETMGNLVRDHLEAAGYLGPFGIDGWEYESITGARMLMPLGEINARRTFGMVAHALVERVARPHWKRVSGPVALRFGRRPEPEDRDHTIPLLGAADAPEMHAWLERLAPVSSRAPSSAHAVRPAPP